MPPFIESLSALATLSWSAKHSGVFFRYSNFSTNFSFLTLLVGQQTGCLACSDLLQLFQCLFLYGDSGDNTVEENSSVFSLIRVC